MLPSVESSPTAPSYSLPLYNFLQRVLCVTASQRTTQHTLANSLQFSLGSSCQRVLSSLCFFDLAFGNPENIYYILFHLERTD